MHYISFIIIVLFFLNSLFCTKLTIKNRTTSLIIPCCASHASHLLELLKMYEQQTELPDEVVISLSESQKVPANIFKELQAKSWIFPINLILSEKKLFAGENRNTACQEAKGDILICQDADDIPHPQRIEIINYFFRMQRVDHIIHQMETLNPEKGIYKREKRTFIKWDENDSIPFDHYKLSNNVPFFFPKDFWTVWCGGIYTSGNIAITREVFDTIKWGNEPRGEDTIFNKKVYNTFKKCIAIEVPLYVCRKHLSSHEDSTAIYKKFHYPEHSVVRKKCYSLKIINSK